MISAKIILDSIHNGSRLITLELRCPKYIDSEFCKHGMIASNSSSDRAKSFKRVSEEEFYLMTDVRSEQKGMQGYTEISEKLFEEFTECTATLRKMNIEFLLRFDGHIHHQHLNRYLIPWSMQSKVATANYESWLGFLKLRLHEDADPAIQELAEYIKQAIDYSSPTELRSDEWHLPYVSYKEKLIWTLEDQKKVSTVRCCKVSYDNHGSSKDLEIDREFYKKLVNADPKHCYDELTEIMTSNGFKLLTDITYSDLIANIDCKTGEILNFEHPLRIIKNMYTGKMYEYDSPDISLHITENHKLIAMQIKKSADRKAILKLDCFAANSLNIGNGYKKKTRGETEMRMLPVPIVNDYTNFIEGELSGFYIGDGFIKGKLSQMSFRLVKKRKITYIKNILNKLNISYSEKISGYTSKRNPIIEILVCDNLLCTFIINDCGIGSSNKKIPNITDVSYLQGIFNGLRNSDGTVRGNTWGYSTTSKSLKKSILDKAPICGLWIKQNKSTVSKGNRKKLYIFMIQMRNNILVNDARRKNMLLKIVDVVDLPTFCVTVSGGGLLTRRNGKTVVSGNSTPLEHCAKPIDKSTTDAWNISTWEQGITHVRKDGVLCSGRFSNWVQLRNCDEN